MLNSIEMSVCNFIHLPINEIALKIGVSSRHVYRVINNLVLKNIIGVLYYSGMRIGELFGLHWSDIDFESYSININKTITKIRFDINTYI